MDLFLISQKSNTHQLARDGSNLPEAPPEETKGSLPSRKKKIDKTLLIFEKTQDLNYKS